jgi:hypothetical protein
MVFREPGSQSGVSKNRSRSDWSRSVLSMSANDARSLPGYHGRFGKGNRGTQDRFPMRSA